MMNERRVIGKEYTVIEFSRKSIIIKDGWWVPRGQVDYTVGTKSLILAIKSHYSVRMRTYGQRT